MQTQRAGAAIRSYEILRNMLDRVITWGHRPEVAGTHARASSSTGDRFAGDCSAPTTLRGPARSCVAPKPKTVRRRCGAADPADRMQAEGDPPPALARGQVCRLTLIDAKSGPRHVPLTQAARTLLDALGDRVS